MEAIYILKKKVTVLEGEEKRKSEDNEGRGEEKERG
jgi:hypothetical protein